MNYITTEQYVLLLDIVDFFTPSNIQTYLIEFCQKKIPCCGRTIYWYFTRVLSNPKYQHMSYYTHKNQIIHASEWYNNAMLYERRCNNDVFGRSVLVQVRHNNSWVPVMVCQIMFCFMIHQMHLLEHIGQFLPEIKQLMKEEEEHPKSTLVIPAIPQSPQSTTFCMDDSDRCMDMDTTDNMDIFTLPEEVITFHMC